MSEEQKKLDGPDFAQGVPGCGSRRGRHDLGTRRGRSGVAWRATVARCSRSGRSAPITTVRSPRACSSRIPSVARGTTPASACAPERRCAHRRSIQSRAGGSSSGTGKSMCGKSSSRRARPSRTAAQCRAGVDRHHRRRCRRKRRRGDAAARGLLRPGHDAERR